ncbi:MAG: ABC transporter permease [Bdellovibrionota bacterium]
MVRRIAKRFLLDRHSATDPVGKGFVSFIAVISISGLSLGVTALLVVTSVMNGFERQLKSVLTSFHGHIILFSRGEPVAEPEQYLEEIPKNFPEVTAISPYIFAEVMLSSAKGVAGTVIEGVHRPTLGQVSRIEEKLVEGRLPDRTSNELNPEIALSAEIARKLRVRVGDSVVLTVPFAKNNESPLVRKLAVVGIVRLGMYDYDNKYALMEISDFQKVLEMPGKVNAFKLLTKDPARSLATTEALNDKYVYPLRARDWSSLNRNLFYAIRLEKVVISIILMAIVLVASFNVISTIMMMVHDKKRQISMLKALGFSKRSTFYVFLTIGSVMSFLGVVLGLGLGRALCALVAWKSIIDLPADIYMLSRLPIEIRPFEWALICFLTIALAVASTLWPSYRVSRESPIEGLRYE